MSNPFEHPVKEDRTKEVKEVKEVTPVDKTDSYLETQEEKTARAVKESTQRLLDNEEK